MTFHKIYTGAVPFGERLFCVAVQPYGGYLSGERTICLLPDVFKRIGEGLFAAVSSRDNRLGIVEIDRGKLAHQRAHLCRTAYDIR